MATFWCTCVKSVSKLLWKCHLGSFNSDQIDWSLGRPKGHYICSSCSAFLWHCWLKSNTKLYVQMMFSQTCFFDFDKLQRKRRIRFMKNILPPKLHLLRNGLGRKFIFLTRFKDNGDLWEHTFGTKVFT